jgi:hypothetical protein
MIHSFFEHIAALPEKERDLFWRSIMAMVDAGVKTKTLPKEMAAYMGAYFKEVDRQLKEKT